MIVEFHPEVATELEADVRFCAERQAGLGERFLAALEFALAGIGDSPRTWPSLEGEIRRRLTRVFPYAIL